MTTPPRVWITRAQPGAARTAARLAEAGYEPLILPLLEIEPIPQPAPDLTGITALAFTSSNGVEAFATLSPERALPVFTVGDATAQAARAVGFQTIASADGALPDLARLLASRIQGGAVLAPGARDPAGDLAALAPGLTVIALPVYAARETSAAPPTPPIDAVVIHSPRAGHALAALWPRLTPPPQAIAISANAAAPLRDLTACHIASAPTETALFDALAGALGNRPPRV